MVVFPFVIVWTILNIMDGYYNDIFYGLLIMNWVFGIILLIIARALMIKVFKGREKKFSLYFESDIDLISGEMGELV